MTIDPHIQEKIDRLVQEMTDAGRMFTAFEVSLAAKDQGVRERHRNLKGSVHEAIARLAGQNYSRTLRDVGAPVQAWVYHRLRDNPHEYQPLDRTQFEQGSAPAARGAALGPGEGASQGASQGAARGAAPLGPAPRNPQPLASQSAAPATESDGAYGTDQKGRLVISSSALGALGVGAGDAVRVTCDADNQEIRLARPSALSGGGPGDVSVSVDDDGKLRLDSDCLKRADLDGMQCYRILARGNLITIRDFS